MSDIVPGIFFVLRIITISRSSLLQSVLAIIYYHTIYCSVMFIDFAWGGWWWTGTSSLC